MSNICEIIVLSIVGYLSVGIVIAMGFVTRGVARVDPAARDASIAFRILLFPGCVVLWPWILRRWARVSVEELQR